MKLTALLFVTLDGVYQGPGAPDEDRRGGFKRGGWLAPYGHIFPERGQTHDLTLVESRSTPSGVTIQTYRPNGRATFGTAADGTAEQSRPYAPFNDQGSGLRARA